MLFERRDRRACSSSPGSLDLHLQKVFSKLDSTSPEHVVRVLLGN
jgi:hypothetical protein